VAKILYIHQYYQTRRNGVVGIAGTRSYEFARRFSTYGHEVVVITSDTRKEFGRFRIHQTIEDGGVKVLWIPVLYSNKMSALRRLIAFSFFAIRSSYAALKIDCDLVFATSTPLTVGIPALIKRLVGTPYVFEVRDLWPEAPIAMGVISNVILIKMLRCFEALVYRYASAVITLSPGMADGVKGVVGDSKRVAMIPNSCDLDLFRPDRPLNNRHRSRLGLGCHDFSCIYFGTMGPANGLDLLIDAALELSSEGNNRVRIVLHGDGKQKSHLMERVSDLGLTNVIFSSPLRDKTEVAEMICEMDLCLTLYRNIPALQKCSPNKLFDALSAGKPVVTNMDGWIADIVVGSRSGIQVSSGSAKDFSDVLVTLSKSPEKCEEMGRNARITAEKFFSRDSKANELLNLLNDVLKSKS